MWMTEPGVVVLSRAFRWMISRATATVSRQRESAPPAAQLLPALGEVSTLVSRSLPTSAALTRNE